MDLVEIVSHSVHRTNVVAMEVQTDLEIFVEVLLMDRPPNVAMIDGAGHYPQVECPEAVLGTGT